MELDKSPKRAEHPAPSSSHLVQAAARKPTAGMGFTEQEALLRPGPEAASVQMNQAPGAPAPAKGKQAPTTSRSPPTADADADGDSKLGGLEGRVASISQQLSNAFAMHTHGTTSPAHALPALPTGARKTSDLARAIRRHWSMLAAMLSAHTHTVLASGIPTHGPREALNLTNVIGDEKQLGDLKSHVMADLDVLVGYVSSHVHHAGEGWTGPNVMPVMVDQAPLASYDCEVRGLPDALEAWNAHRLGAGEAGGGLVNALLAGLAAQRAKARGKELESSGGGEKEGSSPSGGGPGPGSSGAGHRHGRIDVSVVEGLGERNAEPGVSSGRWVNPDQKRAFMERKAEEDFEAKGPKMPDRESSAREGGAKPKSPRGFISVLDGHPAEREPQPQLSPELLEKVKTMLEPDGSSTDNTRLNRSLAPTEEDLDWEKEDPRRR